MNQAVPLLNFLNLPMLKLGGSENLSQCSLRLSLPLQESSSVLDASFPARMLGVHLLVCKELKPKQPKRKS